MESMPPVPYWISLMGLEMHSGNGRWKSTRECFSYRTACIGSETRMAIGYLRSREESRSLISRSMPQWNHYEVGLIWSHFNLSSSGTELLSIATLDECLNGARGQSAESNLSLVATEKGFTVRSSVPSARLEWERTKGYTRFRSAFRTRRNGRATATGSPGQMSFTKETSD